MVRPVIDEFSRLMEAKLTAREEKGEWAFLPIQAAYEALREEMSELTQEVRGYDIYGADTRERIAQECVDVANMAMILCDICGAMPATRERGRIRVLQT